MRDVYIVGTGGLAREVAHIINLLSSNNKIGKFSGYISHDLNEVGNSLPHGEVIGDDAFILSKADDVDIVVGVGHPNLREKIAKLYMRNANIYFPNIVHPSVVLDPSGYHIGQGNIIASGVYISCQVNIGDFNLLNWNCTVGHDVKISSYCVINPGCHISGFANVENTVLLGAGSVVLEGLDICGNAQIGAGAVVTKNIKNPSTYVGVPAQAVVRK